MNAKCETAAEMLRAAVEAQSLIADLIWQREESPIEFDHYISGDGYVHGIDIAAALKVSLEAARAHTGQCYEDWQTARKEYFAEELSQ